MGAPEGWLGGFVPWRGVVVQTAELLVTLGPMEAFPTGVSVELRVTTRQRSRGLERRRDLDAHMRFGVGYPDGSKWQGMGPYCPVSREAPPPSPMMWSTGGGGDARHFTHHYWLWPLPPPGPVTFALAWPEANVEEATIQIEGAVLRAAAQEAQKLWEPLPEEEE
jgi:hypothetical protein